MSFRRLKKVVTAFFDPSVGVCERVDHLAAQGDVFEALEVAESALSKWPHKLPVLIAYAEIQAKLENKAEVIRVCQRMKLERASHAQQLKVASLYQAVNEPLVASELYEQVAEKFNCGFAEVRLAQLRFQFGDLGEAVKGFNRAVIKDQLAAWPVVLETIRDCPVDAVQQSVDTMRAHVADVKNRNCKTLKMLSLLLLRLGKTDEAIVLMREATSCYVKRFQLPGCAESDGSSPPPYPPLRPRFLIIGAMKCGTTTLHSLIDQHPKAVMPYEKELQFFQYPHLDDQWYLENFPNADPGGGWFTGDSSPGYYLFDLVDRIQALLPEVKLLFISRDPVERAISHIRHNSRQGLSAYGVEAALGWIDEFERQLLENPDDGERLVLDITTGKVQGNSFLVLGLYEILLRRWRRAFGKDQLHTLTLEDLTSNPDIEMAKVWEFLQVEPCEIKLEKLNSGSYSKDDAKTLAVKERLRIFYDRVSHLSDRMNG